jgi:hypothetical protein
MIFKVAANKNSNTQICFIVKRRYGIISWAKFWVMIHVLEAGHVVQESLELGCLDDT